MSTKATVGDPAAPVSEYRHARNIVDEKLKQEVVICDGGHRSNGSFVPNQGN